MNKVAISTNSACIFAETAGEYGITLIPFHIIIEGKDYLDPEVDMEKLYVKLDEKKNLPTTSTPSVAEFLQTWQELA
jgi:fatty acid-binding protein DegV